MHFETRQPQPDNTLSKHSIIVFYDTNAYRKKQTVELKECVNVD